MEWFDAEGSGKLRASLAGTASLSWEAEGKLQSAAVSAQAQLAVLRGAMLPGEAGRRTLARRACRRVASFCSTSTTGVQQATVQVWLLFGCM